MEEIELLTVNHFQFKSFVLDGYSWKEVPDATKENMLVLMEKINELTERLNELTIK
jgi:hypothetical protein